MNQLNLSVQKQQYNPKKVEPFNSISLREAKKIMSTCYLLELYCLFCLMFQALQSAPIKLKLTPHYDRIYFCGWSQQASKIQSKNYKLLFIDNTIIQNMFQIKQEVIPDIPQQHTPQTQSMYQQLRRTSQKWFSRSHKRIFDTQGSRHHNQNTQNQSIYAERVMPFELKPQKEMDPAEKSTLMSMMREQIQINCQLYVSKMSKLLQQQAKKIKILGDLLLKNQVELNSRNDVIEKITVKVAKMQKNDSKHSVTGSNLQNLIEKRVFQLEEGMKQIGKMLKNKVNDKVMKVEMQLKEVGNKLKTRFQSSLQEIRESLDERMDRVEKVMQMNNNSSFGIGSSICKSKNNRNDEIERKNLVLTSQIEELKQQMQSFKRKKFKYDNYKLQELETKIQRLEENVSKIETKDSKSSIKNTKSVNLALKSSQTTYLTRTQTPQDHTSSKSKFINKYKSLINNRKQREEVFSSDSSEESQVQQTLVHDEEGTVQRFLRLLDQAQLKVPIKVEIDQTGYIKSADTGMYLVDSLGDGFEFTFDDLSDLRQRCIIQL